MLKKLILENWKSFRYAELDIDPLTILIGTNASGKSNAIDALIFLQRIVQRQEFKTVLAESSIRGGSEWAARKPETQFTLKALVGSDDERLEYLYSITVETQPHVLLLSESLIQIKKQEDANKSPDRVILLQAEYGPIAGPHYGIIVSLLPETQNSVTLVADIFSILVLGQIGDMHVLTANNRTPSPIEKEVKNGLSTVINVLKNISILDPVPSRMRGYSPLSDSLQSDASNIAGVLAALPDERKTEVQSILTSYVTKLPEREIQKVWAEPVGRLSSDAMLYCEEQWDPKKPSTIIDARSMSDGTLRFLAILTALLTRPEGSQIVIEEVDNGLHPSRSNLLLKMLRELGAKRKIDILVTTHNPALLDELGPKMIPFIVVAHRDPETGESKLTLLEDLDNLPKLMAFGPLGKITSQGLIEESLSGAR
jgi:predicted ATPase